MTLLNDRFRDVVSETSAYFQTPFLHAASLQPESNSHDFSRKCFALQVALGHWNGGTDPDRIRNTFKVVGARSELGASHDFRESEGLVAGES